MGPVVLSWNLAQQGELERTRRLRSEGLALNKHWRSDESQPPDFQLQLIASRPD